jgi:leukotriene A-4 hydrolase/aminopeptidase
VKDVAHIDLDLDVSFDRRQIAGRATHHLRNKTKSPGILELDTRELTISAVRAGAGNKLESCDFELSPPHKFEGSKLRIAVPKGVERVEVTYTTAPSASGLQWLAPSQTAGKRHPFLYSQSQAIHARSWVPCIDEPAVRVTIDAVVRVPGGLRAVMGAEDRTRPNEAGTFRFHMPQPIPSYLLALAVGELEHRDIGKRSGVWAEPSVVDKAAWEFGDTEKMIEAAEALYGPYRWGRYDVLVLPPSFPMGGMENPRLTFATPTVIAGDRSLVALVAHELAHSWSGNLATNATWNDFWLNEGFTVYFERRIQEQLYGRARAEMEASLGRQRVEATIEELKSKPEDTWLWMDLWDRDPDDGVTDVPYEKGYLFLRLLEETFGRRAFDTFLRRHFDEHAFQSLTTAEFLSYLDKHLLSKDRKKAATLGLHSWIYGPGLPNNAPRAQSDAFKRVKQSAGAWLSGKAGLDRDAAKAWTAHEWIHFLQQIPKDLPAARLAELDEAFQLTNSGNSEILCEWLKLTVAAGYTQARPKLRAFLLEVGRRKFLKPLYQELARSEAGKAEAREIYAQARAGYHSISRQTLDEMLGV